MKEKFRNLTFAFPLSEKNSLLRLFVKLERSPNPSVEHRQIHQNGIYVLVVRFSNLIDFYAKSLATEEFSQLKHLGEKVLGAGILGVINNLVRSPLLHDFTFVHEHHMVGDFPGKANLVGDHNHGHPSARQILHN